MNSYDIDRYFEYLGYARGDLTYTCKNQRSLVVWCRGDREQMERLLEPTPFKLADDRFKISVADFSENTLGDQFTRPAPFLDAGIVLAVEFEGTVGSTYYYEWENIHETVAGGRELHGYPKRFASVSLEESETGVKGRVTLEGLLVLDVDFAFDESVAASGGEGFPAVPHLQVRAVPEFDGSSFSQFDILGRDSGKDLQVHSRRFLGTAEVTYGEAFAAAGEPFEIATVLGAEYVIQDFATSSENGIMYRVASLV
ncbi:MAG: acetoacetate decarboxylase family protein [Luteolibacter sp.]